MTGSPLPPATTGTIDAFPPCPWCKADPGEATFTLTQLVEAHDAGQLFGFVNRGPDGQGSPAAAAGDCPHCCRPFMLSARREQGWNFFRLIPIRTAAEARRWREGDR